MSVEPSEKTPYKIHAPELGEIVDKFEKIRESGREVVSFKNDEENYNKLNKYIKSLIEKKDKCIKDNEDHNKRLQDLIETRKTCVAENIKIEEFLNNLIEPEKYTDDIKNKINDVRELLTQKKEICNNLINEIKNENNTIDDISNKIRTTTDELNNLIESDTTAKRIAAKESERLAEEERVEAERLATEEAERLAAEEAERLAAAQAAAQAAEKAERVEAERLATEEAERLATEEAERLVAAQAAEKAERVEAERVEAERLAAARAAQAAERAETERLRREDDDRIQAEAAKVAAEKKRIADAPAIEEAKTEKYGEKMNEKFTIYKTTELFVGPTSIDIFIDTKNNTTTNIINLFEINSTHLGDIHMGKIPTGHAEFSIMSKDNTPGITGILPDGYTSTPYGAVSAKVFLITKLKDENTYRKKSIGWTAKHNLENLAKKNNELTGDGDAEYHKYFLSVVSKGNYSNKDPMSAARNEAARKKKIKQKVGGGFMTNPDSITPVSVNSCSALSFLDMYGGENKSNVNIMAIKNRTRKNYRGGYRYSELGMKGLTIALSDGAKVFAPKKAKKAKKAKTSKRKSGKNGNKGKKMKVGKVSVRRNKGSAKRARKR